VNGPSLGERLIVPAVVWLLVGAMSGAFMYGSRGATGRMKVVFRYSMLFTGGLFYSIAWKDVLARLSGWQGAWIGVAVLFGVASFWLCRSQFKQRPDGNPLP
jgi:hypothetical protein